MLKRSTVSKRSRPHSKTYSLSDASATVDSGAAGAGAGSPPPPHATMPNTATHTTENSLAGTLRT